MGEVRITTVRAIKSYKGLRINVPAAVIRAAELKPGDLIGYVVDPDRPLEFVVRKVG